MKYLLANTVISIFICLLFFFYYQTTDHQHIKDAIPSFVFWLFVALLLFVMFG